MNDTKKIIVISVVILLLTLLDILLFSAQFTLFQIVGVDLVLLALTACVRVVFLLNQVRKNFDYMDEEEDYYEH
jgi:hypothetical protein